jgi:RHH-type proline utilization regulon transcriptional repressor/proline dehydrogenase/delta 1-pyrroline-5-carboxylate dehydrogenase
MTASAQPELRARIRADHRLPEARAVERLRARAALAPDVERRIAERALGLAARVRAAPRNPWSAEAFLSHHGLSTAEGVALMCLAEALLRIPDPEKADELLREKLGSGRWEDAPDDGSLMASAADWALMLTGKLARWAAEPDEDLGARVRRIVARLG